MRKGLEAWLGNNLIDVSDVRLSSLRFPTGTGRSADTVFADMTYQHGGTEKTRSLAIRCEKEANGLFLDASMELPYEMMRGLDAYPLVPSPRAIGIETNHHVIGTPFLVMEFVKGRVVDQKPNYHLEGWLKDLPVEEREKPWLSLMETLAHLHNLDWQEQFTFLDQSNAKQPGLHQYLDYVQRWYDWAKKDRDMPVADRAMAWLHENRPIDAEVCVLWGDPNPANTLFSEENTVAAILDFEMSALGAGEADLAWWFMIVDTMSTDIGVPMLEGLPTREACIAYYEEIRGKPVSNMDYYDVLASFRMNILLTRAIDAIVAAGMFPGDTDAYTRNPYTSSIAETLGLGSVEPGNGYFKMRELG